MDTSAAIAHHHRWDKMELCGYTNEGRETQTYTVARATDLRSCIAHLFLCYLIARRLRCASELKVSAQS
jgi:hypothetical protein